MSERVSFGIDARGAMEDIRKGAVRGVTAASEHWLTESNKHVPHDEGTLERSGSTGVDDSGEIVWGSVSYDTPYAVRQHEDMTLHHDGKGEAKWLENTGTAEANTMMQVVANEIRQAAGT